MNKAKLLDCTLRDGGYVNDWEFGHNTLTSVLERLVSAGVDIIEVGFLDERRPFDENRSIMPDTASVQKIYGKVNKGQSAIVAMIDYGTCGIDKLQPCAESYLDGIRVIFKKHVMHEAIDFCKQVKALGYKVFTQAVSITSYSDDELLQLIALVNDLQPYALSMVDTYGLLHQSNLMHIFEIMDKHLDSAISIGYHAHNNFQMGYANCIEVLEKPTSRPLVVDATLYGMGKSAGNTPIELLANYMNENGGHTYDLNQILEAIEVDVLDIYRRIPWGYTLFYYVAASHKCHPNYVAYLLNKKALSIRSVGEILDSIPTEKKLLYDQKYIESLYLDYQRMECDDTAAVAALKGALGGREVLLLGPGRCVRDEAATIAAYIREHSPVIISINYQPPGFTPDYVFFSNAKRYSQMASQLLEPEYANLPLIATSNVLKTSGQFTFVLNYSRLIDAATDIPDNSLVMFLRVLREVGAARIALAGFDGYVPSKMNYFNTNMEYDFVKDKAAYLNDYVRGFLASMQGQPPVVFVTKSRYQEQDA